MILAGKREIKRMGEQIFFKKTEGETYYCPLYQNYYLTLQFHEARITRLVVFIYP